MKLSKNTKFSGLIIAFMVAVLTPSCKKFLEKEPPSNITPENYLVEESQLGAYAINQYVGILPSHNMNTNNGPSYSWGTFGTDANTDNMSGLTQDDRWSPGLLKVPAGVDNVWSFTNIYQCNYFLQTVIPRWKAGKITGNPDNIKQYIGEMYFLRAYVYFTKLQALGDFPIIKTTLPDNQQILTEASKRAPCSEVARFILSDLDSAAMLMKVVSDGGKNRLSQPCAQLLKSRVALYEGTWLKYFKGTAFVPNGNGWPGTAKAYNAGYKFKSGSIDNEVEYFLGEAMAAAKTVADAFDLVNNTGIIESPNNENPYFSMFGALNMSTYGEVLLWRQFSPTITHNVPVYAQYNNNAVGLTRSMVESFVMSNGLPIYAPGSGYQGDDYITDQRTNRDGRLFLFLKDPGQKNVLVNQGKGNHETDVEPVPQIFLSGAEQKYTTGYTIRKGISYDGAQANNGGGYTGSITFRATEAYLNYMEACYEKTGAIDGTAASYWQKIRTRAKVDPDYNKTIAATDMSKETRDWGAYSAGQIISPTLFNIRRERRDELMAEGLRFMDLKRWRALDQLINTPAHIEGFKIWGPMKGWYTPEQLVYGAANNGAIVSDPALGPYLRPYEIRSNADSYKGARWAMAHYLSPIAVQNFAITSQNGDYSSSPIYQNPGWPIVGGASPTGY
ncbi:MAG: starch-binding protein [Mucilaginibacter sp.]|nr:starch-binding protein [Mucilaginibacter sp.]